MAVELEMEVPEDAERALEALVPVLVTMGQSAMEEMEPEMVEMTWEVDLVEGLVLVETLPGVVLAVD